MAIIQDWKITSRAHVCSHTEKPFEDEEEFYTCIFDDPESDGFIRRDYSVPSWKEISPTLEKKPFSFWKSTYKAPEKIEKEEAIEKNSAEGMLRWMIEDDDPRTENARYILALMLERKKTLIPTDTQETETRKILFYQHKETGEVFLVADPNLKLDEIENVQKEVADLLSGKSDYQPKEKKANEPASNVSESSVPTYENEFLLSKVVHFRSKPDRSKKCFPRINRVDLTNQPYWIVKRYLQRSSN